MAPILLAPLLGAIGFSEIGPVAGSLAAGAQAAFYGGSVPAGSMFAGMQRAAMGALSEELYRSSWGSSGSELLWWRSRCSLELGERTLWIHEDVLER
ncbi:hypothetical protein HD553DRAFT_339612 [Filobasidium floriforme]|uniref:uncharacterized protein n=1 Tax=Filobasidium floriforme TaxID=5210 RepID=UPI001E8D7A16|nr:uncharacterized protein HD553DRAFT_339612 [Filobasidium floriforme]KAH8088272.1 hypothetical protein HD553DRAFT_339612 [Filobasidium floriforme]